MIGILAATAWATFLGYTVWYFTMAKPLRPFNIGRSPGFMEDPQTKRQLPVNKMA